MTTFEQCLPLILKSEGGYVNDPQDPGGATNKGITQAVYDAWRRERGQSPSPVRNISDAEVASIYRANYWDKVRADELPSGVSYVVFDGAVNSGTSRSVKWLQKALGVMDDGIIGPATIAAANAYPSPAVLVDKICDRRLKFLQALPTWGHFGGGWSSRVASVRAQGKAWA